MNYDDHSACVAALSESLAEVAATVLGGLGVDTLSEQAGPAPPHGAFLAIVAQGEPIQLGLLADAGGCQRLAKTLLGMEPDDEELPTSDVSDAMCEIINIVAGGVKRRVSARLGVTLGLPIFVAGPPLPNPQQDISSLTMSLGDVRVNLLLLTQAQRQEPISKSAIRSGPGRGPAKEHSA